MVLRGRVRVERVRVLDVQAGQAVVTAPRRMGPLQHARGRRRRVRRRLPARVLAGDRPSGRVTPERRQVETTGRYVAMTWAAVRDAGTEAAKHRPGSRGPGGRRSWRAAVGG